MGGVAGQAGSQRGPLGLLSVDSIGLVNAVAGFAIDGGLVLVECADLAFVQRLGGLQQRRGFLLPTGCVAFGGFVQWQGFVVFNKFCEVFVRALTLGDFLGEGVIAFMQGLHDFFDGVFGFVLRLDWKEPNHEAGSDADGNDGV